MVDYTKRPRQPEPPQQPPQQPPAPPGQWGPPPTPPPPPAPPGQWGPPPQQPPPPGQWGPPPGPPPGQWDAPPPAAPPVSLNKVTLTKSAPSVSLTKTAGTTGLLRVNLNWNARPAQQGGFFRRAAGGGGIDLDLGCLYEFVDGSKGVIQALGNAFRGQHSLGNGDAVAWLDGDDRSGSSTGGENLLIDLKYTHLIRRLLVFAFIYEGVPNWAAANAVVTMFPANGPQIEVHLDEHDPRAATCAIALLQNQGGELVVNREVRYINGGQDLLDRTYGWGMNWSAGRK